MYWVISAAMPDPRLVGSAPGSNQLMYWVTSVVECPQLPVAGSDHLMCWVISAPAICSASRTLSHPGRGQLMMIEQDKEAWEEGFMAGDEREPRVSVSGRKPRGLVMAQRPS